MHNSAQHTFLNRRKKSLASHTAKPATSRAELPAANTLLQRGCSVSTPTPLPSALTIGQTKRRLWFFYSTAVVPSLI